MFKQLKIASCFLSLVGVACAAPGTQPHDMSATQHEAMAKQEDQAAVTHEGQLDPKAVKETTTCSRGNVCWTSKSNPTKQHQDDANSHRELAAKHRMAAGALTQAEAQACAGIDEEDRDTSPFYHREDIASVTPLEKAYGGKRTGSATIGATVMFRAVPGLTAEWLQREVNCHIARASAVGHQMPEMDYCPLAVKGAKASVSSVGDGFAVVVSSDDAATSAEIWKRAQALKSSANEPSGPSASK